MSRYFRGWTRGSGVSEDTNPSNDPSGTKEAAQLEEAMEAANLIMNDELELAERKLDAGHSVFHVAGKGVILFLKAMLGFEQEAIKEATTRLVEAESLAWKEIQLAHRNSKSWRSEVYPAGTQYTICLASTQIMLAVLGVLSQSVTESIKGFYKARKAFQTLEAAAEVEAKYMKKHGYRNAHEALHGKQDGRDASIASDLSNRAHPGAREETFESSKDPLSHPIDKWISATTSSQFGILLTLISMVPPSFTKLLSIVGFRGDLKRGLGLLWRASAKADLNGSVAGLVLLSYHNNLVATVDIREADGYPEVRLRKLLEVMRNRYPQSQLWLLETARVFSAGKDIESAVRLLEAGQPTMRGRDDKLLKGSLSPENGTVAPAEGDSDTSAESMAPVKDSNPMLKQLSGLNLFQRSLELMYLHDYQSCVGKFLEYINMTDFGHGLYYYIAGAAHVELYRIYTDGGALPNITTTPTTFSAVTADPKKAANHAQLAEKHLTEAPNHTGKKRLFGRPLPFDVFVSRKINKWRKRAAALGCPLIEAIGSSPFEELIYFWFGYGRMLDPQLEHSLQRLSWSNSPSSGPTPNGDSTSTASDVQQHRPRTETFDDRAITAFLRAVIYRHLKRTTEASTLLRTEIIDKHPWSEFKAAASAGGCGDTYPAPMARYELAACLWAERYQDVQPNCAMRDETGAQVNRSKLAACAKLLDEVGRWESFDLDQRMSIKITSGQRTLKALI